VLARAETFVRDARAESANVKRMKADVGSLVLALTLGSRAAVAQENQDLSSGGLAPPPSLSTEPTTTEPTVTEQQLERADREDAGRGLSFCWVNGEVGYELLGLHTFHDGDLVDGEIVDSSQNGLAFGGALGVRLIFITIGARFRLATFEKSTLWTLNAEGGFRIPIGRLEPYFTFGGGYVSLGSFDTGRAFDDAGGSSSDLSIHGFNLRGSAGLDYFVGRSLSLGANLSGDLLFLSRGRVSGLDANATDLAVYAEDGSSVGGATALMAVVGLHF
jgi:hypothetical protein